MDAGGPSFEVRNGPSEEWTLMRETVMFLTRPGGGHEVIQKSVQETEICLLGYLDELGVLDHHSLRDADEGFTRRGESRPPS